jgi:hypothetical protein
MHEKTLLKIALVFSILGIIALFFISQNVKLTSSTILEEDGKYLVEGEIQRITQRDKVTFIDLQREDPLTVVLFKDYPVDLHKGDYIEVSGKASKDQDGEMQLIGNDVRVIK